MGHSVSFFAQGRIANLKEYFPEGDAYIVVMSHLGVVLGEGPVLKDDYFEIYLPSEDVEWDWRERAKNGVLFVVRGKGAPIVACGDGDHAVWDVNEAPFKELYLWLNPKLTVPVADPELRISGEIEGPYDSRIWEAVAGTNYNTSKIDTSNGHLNAIRTNTSTIGLANERLDAIRAHVSGIGSMKERLDQILAQTEGGTNVHLDKVEQAVERMDAVSFTENAAGPRVFEIQQQLVKLGYWIPNHEYDPNRVAASRLGAATVNAIKSFQADQNLPVTGIAAEGSPGTVRA